MNFIHVNHWFLINSQSSVIHQYLILEYGITPHKETQYPLAVRAFLPHPHPDPTTLAQGNHYSIVCLCKFTSSGHFL